MTANPIIPKFEIGDEVEVIMSGAGFPAKEIGTKVIIAEVGKYTTDVADQVGYRIVDPHLYKCNGHPDYYAFDGFVGESSFKLVKKAIPILSPEEQEKQISTYRKTKEKMAQKVKNMTKNKTQEVRTIETSLINKGEVFKMLALAESTSLPLLLQGNPGVAKTKTVIEYAKAYLLKNGLATEKDFMEKIYILETDEGTKQSEIKGMPDLGKLFTENQYELSAPITEAEVIIINEVDKASSAIRNAMLGVMNEKFLFSGKQKIKCKWKLFVATCNEIPKDEIGSPFWDRFMLKMPVSRVSAGDMIKYYEKGSRDYREKFTIGIPSKAEIDTVIVPKTKLEKYLQVAYNQSSDRTLTFVPMLTKAVSFIWDSSVDKAMVKVAEIMVGKNAGTQLGDQLTSTEMKVIMSKIEMLKSHNDKQTLELAVAEIEMMVGGYAAKNLVDEDQIQEIEMTIQYVLEHHPASQQGAADEETLAELLEDADMSQSEIVSAQPF
jgi:MoxR-like ATPase